MTTLMPCVEQEFEQETYFLLQFYVYKCFSQVDEVMLTLKQAFSTAAAMQSSKNQVKLCEDCPMHDLHKLCERIEGKATNFHQFTQCTHLSFSTIFQCVSLNVPGLYPPRAKLAIQKYLSQLSDNEQVNIFERVQVGKPGEILQTK